jgi:hypothetical protein
MLSPLEGHVNSRFSLHDVFYAILISLAVISLPNCHPSTCIKTFYVLK